MDKVKIEVIEQDDILEISEIETDDNFMCCIIGGGKGPT